MKALHVVPRKMPTGVCAAVCGACPSVVLPGRYQGWYTNFNAVAEVGILPALTLPRTPGRPLDRAESVVDSDPPPSEEETLLGDEASLGIECFCLRLILSRFASSISGSRCIWLGRFLSGTWLLGSRVVALFLQHPEAPNETTSLTEAEVITGWNSARLITTCLVHSLRTLRLFSLVRRYQR